MKSRVTRCPHCGSTFNINQQQLASSGGLARCGACLRVFAAADNLLEPAEETLEATPAPPAADETCDDEALALPEIEDRFEVLPAEEHETLRQLTATVQLRGGSDFNWSAFFGFSTLALSLLALLAAQHLWRYLPVYSQVDWLRPGYARICALAGCELPVYSRPSSFRNDSTTLSTHPDYPDAYLLAARFYNAAPFAQPFPVVVLRFTSLDARTVAMREFAPAEYLHPDLLALDLMPPNSPVQIELELINPGPRAVNYEVSFRAP